MKDMIANRIAKAKATNRFIVICLRVQNDEVHCDFDAVNFPTADLDVAAQLATDAIMGQKEVKENQQSQ